MRPWTLVEEGGAIPVIAGPCSAESEKQVMLTADGLRAVGVSHFRAGLWKPRTHPGCFEGVGSQGLPWLCKVRDSYGMKVGTEVDGPAHVEECLKVGLDFLWIGARTTSSPFLVQEIASALKGVEDVPVLVKNPLSPDLGLWCGAVERLEGEGVGLVGLVHRGFTPVGQTAYRNDPMWKLAVEMRTRFPDIPFLADPSHIGGSARFLKDLSQRSLDLGFDGLIVESHCNPCEALSDSSQQVTPYELGRILGSLVLRSKTSDDETFNSRLEELRLRIDSIDDSLLGLLAERMEVSDMIGKIKKEHAVAIVQTSRWENLLAGMVRKGEALGLDASYIKEVFSAIHEASVAAQNKLFK